MRLLVVTAVWFRMTIIWISNLLLWWKREVENLQKQWFVQSTSLAAIIIKAYCLCIWKEHDWNLTWSYESGACNSSREKITFMLQFWFAVDRGNAMLAQSCRLPLPKPKQHPFSACMWLLILLSECTVQVAIVRIIWWVSDTAEVCYSIVKFLPAPVILAICTHSS